MIDDIFENNLQHFKIQRRYGDRVQAVCPAHNDKQASLTISRGDKCTLFYCHAGCNIDDILSSVGLTKQETFYCNELKPDWKSYVESREKRKIESVYNYSNLDGTYAFTKLRLQGKKIVYGMLKDGVFRYGLPRDTPRKSFNAIYGNLNAIKKAISNGDKLFITEGEKDTNTLTKQGYVAFTSGGCSDWKQDYAKLVKDAEVIILADNDAPGINLANRILNDIQSIAKSSKIVIPVPDIPKADISDFFDSGHTKAEFESLINNVTEKRMVQKEKSLVDILVEMNAAETFETNDKDFGKLFAVVFKDKHRYNSTIKDFMVFDGNRWVEDIEGLSARTDAKKLSDALITYAAQVGDTEYLKQVSVLCNLRNRNNMITDSRDLYYFDNSALDKNDYILNVTNGILDLSENEPKFLPHNPNMLLSKICNAEYNPQASCDIWLNFLAQITEGNLEKMKFLQKICGLSLTGNTSEETCFILYGSTTRNGKSTFTETISFLLGDYALTMKPESLAIKQNNDSRTASGDIARLKGCRFVNASEPPKRMIFDCALLKNLLGRDSVTARFLHQREFEFMPKFKLVINSNYLPTISDTTLFSSGRINVITFDRHFEPYEQDKTLKDKLRNKAELSGILNWCIQGLALYRKEGLTPPQCVQNATESYRSDSDKIGNFINERLVKSDKNSSAKQIYEIYTDWCSDNGYGTENKGNFFSELKSKGIFATSGTVNGKTVKNIVKGYVPDSDFNNDCPFK